VRAGQGSAGLTSGTSTAAGWDSRTGPATRLPFGVNLNPAAAARPGTSAGRDGNRAQPDQLLGRKPSQSVSQRPRHAKGATDLPLLWGHRLALRHPCPALHGSPSDPPQHRPCPRLRCPAQPPPGRGQGPGLASVVRSSNAQGTHRSLPWA